MKQEQYKELQMSINRSLLKSEEKYGSPDFKKIDIVGTFFLCSFLMLLFIPTLTIILLSIYEIGFSDGYGLTRVFGSYKSDHSIDIIIITDVCIFAFFLIKLIGQTIKTSISNYHCGFFRKLLDFNNELYITISRVDSIEKIIEKIQSILKILTRFEKIGKYIQIGRFGIDAVNIFSIQLEKKWLNEVVQDLINDLSKNIKNQQNSLESAKGEVENLKQAYLHPLSGGLETGLIQVSELQKDRLDRQIEQFEELQRVLIKV